MVNKIDHLSWREYIKNPNLLHDIANINVPAIFINAGKDIRLNWPTEQLANLIKKGNDLATSASEAFYFTIQ